MVRPLIGAVNDHVAVIVIGGGIAGVSISYELSAAVRVSVLEMESTLRITPPGGRRLPSWKPMGENRSAR